MSRLVFFFFTTLALSGCSLIVEQRAVQCAVDADCEGFAPHPFCVEGVCVESGLGPAGCFAGAARTDAEFLNQCSTGCVPFDNCARLGWCDAAAELPALLPRP